MQHNLADDNRPIWLTVAPRVACPPLEQLVGFYVATSISTGGLERALGRVADMVHKHKGPLLATTKTDLLTILLDGPSDENGLYSAAPALQPTALAERCETLWVRHYKRRWRLSKETRADKGRRRRCWEDKAAWTKPVVSERHQAGDETHQFQKPPGRWHHRTSDLCPTFLHLCFALSRSRQLTRRRNASRSWPWTGWGA